MIGNRKLVLSWLALSEGGLVDHPQDPGGLTNKGVTQRVYTAWLRTQGRPVRSVREITTTEADLIFVDQYFKPVMFDALPPGVDYAMADYSVNSGPGRAVLDLQRTLNDMGQKVAVDGHMGLITLAAVRAVDPAQLVIKLCERRMAFLRSLKTFKTFGRGWTRRVMGEHTGAQDDDTGVIDRGARMARADVMTSQPKPAPGRATGPQTSGIVAAIIHLIGGIFGWRPSTSS